MLCAGGPVSPRASLTLLSSQQPGQQPDLRRGRRGAFGGAQEQRDADDAAVSCARPALRRRPCLATSISDPSAPRCSLGGNNVNSNLTNLVADRLRVNKLVRKIASWVASAMARRVELWDDNLVMQTLAARAAVLAFGDELVDLELPNESGSQWLSPSGRALAAALLLPIAEAALRQEFQRLADAVKGGR
jgi:hypothetical protein